MNNPEPSDSATPAEQTPDRIIRDVILYYGCYADRAAPKVEELLGFLSFRDPQKSDLWRRIMALWRDVNTNLRIRTDTLPDDLPAGNELCIIALGYGLNPDGSMCAEHIGRARTTLSCARQYPNAYVLCTGGHTARENPATSEAGAMGEWLLAHGLSKDRLIIEDRSLSTVENAVFSHRLLLERFPHVQSAALVSSSYHIPWSWLLFGAVFMKAAAEGCVPEMRLIANCAFPAVNERFRVDTLLRWQTGGMLELTGQKELARKFYRNEPIVIPPL